MKRVVITGAGSMIGVATATACLEQGKEVIALVHRRETAERRLPHSARLTIIELPMEQFASYEPEIRADVFYHFAWQATKRANGVDGRANPVVQQENIGFTLAAVELALDVVEPLVGEVLVDGVDDGGLLVEDEV